MVKIILKAWSICTVVLILSQTVLSAEDGYIVSSQNSAIVCSVKYSLIGKYTARFKDFSGLVYFDPKNLSKSSVYLKIKVVSLESKYATLDRMAKSKRLWDASIYPEAIFQSQRIELKDDKYYVTGILKLHGVERQITFPFTLDGPRVEGKKKYVTARGIWLIDRKKFNILWHKYLDKGGVVVGNQITLNWKIKAFK